MENPSRPIETALVSVWLKFGWRAGRIPSAIYTMDVDGKRMGTSPNGTVSANVLPVGPHTVDVVITPWVSDIIPLDLNGGDHVDLACEM